MTEYDDTKKTVDHDTVKRWVTERKGRPTLVKATTDKRGSGILRIDFGESDDALEELSWDEFFRIFDENKLAFLHEEHTKDGEISRFYKFVNRE